MHTPIRHKGNDYLFTAVELSVLSTYMGIPLHVHAEGLRGTGKTTVMRWFAQNMPQIQRRKDCPYNCLDGSCPIHDRGSALELETVRMPFVEIGHGAKIGTVLGSIDIKRLVDAKRPEACIIPGAVPMANRGVLFVDEINRLAETAPEITDILLSVMGTKPGRVKIEETGLAAYEIEVCASVWAASNPDEDPGPLEDIRKQLADRFDLVVPVDRPQDPDVVERLIWPDREDSTSYFDSQNILRAAQLFQGVTVPAEIRRSIANVYVQHNIESLRAVQAMELCSRLLASLRGKESVTFDELIAVVPAVLRHRVEPAAMADILKELEGRKNPGGRSSQVFPSKPAEIPEPVRPQDPPRVSQPSAGRNETRVERRMSGTLRGLFSKLTSLVSRAGRADAVQSANAASTGAAPVSPPDRARRITEIPWEDTVNAPDWKDILG